MKGGRYKRAVGATHLTSRSVLAMNREMALWIFLILACREVVKALDRFLPATPVILQPTNMGENA